MDRMCLLLEKPSVYASFFPWPQERLGEGQMGCLQPETTRQGKTRGRQSVVAACDRMGSNEFPLLKVRSWRNVQFGILLLLGSAEESSWGP